MTEQEIINAVAGAAQGTVWHVAFAVLMVVVIAKVLDL